MLLNREGKVWVGQRLDNALDAWQMPQGGLDPGEDAARRRLSRAGGGDRHHRATCRADRAGPGGTALRSAARPDRQGLEGEVARPAADLVPDALHRQRRGREHRDRGSRIPRLEMGRPRRAAGDDRAVQEEALRGRAEGVRGVAYRPPAASMSSRHAASASAPRSLARKRLQLQRLMGDDRRAPRRRRSGAAAPLRLPAPDRPDRSARSPPCRHDDRRRSPRPRSRPARRPAAGNGSPRRSDGGSRSRNRLVRTPPVRPASSAPASASDGGTGSPEPFRDGRISAIAPPRLERRPWARPAWHNDDSVSGTPFSCIDRSFVPSMFR